MPKISRPSTPEGTVWFGGHPDGAALCLPVCGDDLNPDEITELIGRAPSRSQCRGQSILDSSGKVKRVARTGSWLLDYPLGAEATIEEAIELLLGGLSDDDRKWAALGQRFRVDLFCDVFVHGVNRGFELSPHVLGLLAVAGSCWEWTSFASRTLSKRRSYRNGLAVAPDEARPPTSRLVLFRPAR
jgi:hypothetical protein